MNQFVWMTAAVAVAAMLGGCDKSPGKAPAAQATAQADANSTEREFQVHGVVVEVHPDEKSVTIKHDEVPGYMQAMTMPFAVRNTNELAGLGPGDPVTFRLRVTDTDGWIDRVHITGPKTNTPPTTGPVRLVRDVEPLSEGDLLPPYQFTNQFGRPFSTADFKGQALAIEFLFTRCPYPTYCPLMANHFEQAQRELLNGTNVPPNWHLLTISFDTKFDTPQVLREYAENHHYDPSRWTFASGQLIDVTAIGEQVGLTFWHDESGGLSHNLRAVVVDASGRVQKIFIGNQWTPQELALELQKAARR